jgi:hypothetical protein
VDSDFNCIIGPGDACKTTILTALDYALSPRTSLSFDDTDFFNQDINQDIIIQVTLSEWDEKRADIKKLFQESKFAQYQCGLDGNGPLSEPRANGPIAVSVSLRVDKSLEPKWFVVKGCEEDEAAERKPLYAGDRATFGLSRLDTYSDYQFTWGRNTILTRLSANNEGNLRAVLSDLSREMRQGDISKSQSIIECQGIADKVRVDAKGVGVKLNALSPKIDIQRQSTTTGALSLHEDNVPIRSKGSGTKKLIAAAMQMKLNNGKNIALIDEVEIGLEPHRIRGLLLRLKGTGQQVFTTTHSPVVIRELNITNNELYVCRRDADGNVSLESLATVPGIQGPVRSNAEAFLGRKIVVCEGATEIGCLRAYDNFRLERGDIPVWSLATAYFNASGGGYIKVVCPKLLSLGYRTAAFCDNDKADQINEEDARKLRQKGVHVCQWEIGNSTERQLFLDLPWPHVHELLSLIAKHHGTLELASITDLVRKDPRCVELDLEPALDQWSEAKVLREVIGDLVGKREWIKRINLAQCVFRFAIPHLPEDTVLKKRLGALWDWIQCE